MMMDVETIVTAHALDKRLSTLPEGLPKQKLSDV
jgi:hypothetical protein